MATPRPVVLTAAVVCWCVLIVVGCTNQPVSSDRTTVDADSSATTGLSTTTIEANGPLAQKWEGMADLGDLQIVVSAPVDDTANLGETELLFLEEGEKVVYCLVTISNTGSQSYAYNMLYFTMHDTDDFTHDAFGVSTQPPLASGDILPGKSVKGAVGFDMPIAAVPAYVTFQREVFGDTVAAWGE